MIDTIISVKRDGGELSPQQISWFITRLTSGKIPDYQTSALLMAMYINGLNARECAALTLSMAQSGDMCDLSGIPGVKVDKHSSGGVADTVTPVLAPMLAACGLTVAKMSGRGLGHTGGTIDKLESISGFRTDFDYKDFLRLAAENRLCVVGQSGSLCPADKILYALRDVTQTVGSIPLIAASIMSKKLAAGADCILLDVKCGSGALMKTIDNARTLAQTMVDIGKAAGKKTVAVITDMNAPLGMQIGNSLEISEALEILRGGRRDAVSEICIDLGAELLVMSATAESLQQGRERMTEALDDGSAYKAFVRFVIGQGGSLQALDNLPQARYTVEITAKRDGFISAFNAEKIGLASVALGAGRKVKTDVIDPGAGITMCVRKGDCVRKGMTVAVLHASDTTLFDNAADIFKSGIEYSDTPPLPAPLILDTIR